MKYTIRNIKTEEFDYPLTEDRIAKYPLPDRDQSKLLIYKKGNINSDYFFNLHQCISESSLLVFNNTRVIPARLLFNKPTGAIIEVFCLEPVDPPEYHLSFALKQKTVWKCITGNLKRWKTNPIQMILQNNNVNICLKATLLKNYGASQEIEFSWDNENITFAELLELAGKTPIPPYLNRPTEEVDKERYQTIYSKINGSVAAPTAGLHFTDRVLQSLSEKKIEKTEVTLHVGAGTFIPVKSSDISKHEMHEEFFSVSLETLKKLYTHNQPIFSVGTTALRTLESLYWLGLKCINNQDFSFLKQWECYEMKANISNKDALARLIEVLEKTGKPSLNAKTSLMIIPGYPFQTINGLITNFHQPKSTLLMLVAAFVGDDWKKIYRYALENNFRFLSYGDSSVLYGR